MLNEGYQLNDRYQIVKRIGQGGMAEMFLANDRILNRQVAVKVLHKHFSNNSEVKKRFKQEAFATSELSHANIVSIYDNGESEGYLYFVMEYVKGVNLKEYIKMNYPFYYFSFIQMSMQIVSAVGEAHRVGIVHRDLKPQNILINKEGLIKVTDFGIAILLSKSTVKQTKKVLGSVLYIYIYPEQAQGHRATFQSDIYSVGIILFELLTGTIPYEGDYPVAIALQHISGNVPSIRRFDKNVPQAIENIIFKATAANPGDRYKNMEEMLDDFATSLSPERVGEPLWQTNDLNKDNDLSGSVGERQSFSKEEARDKIYMLLFICFVLLLICVSFGFILFLR